MPGSYKVAMPYKYRNDDYNDLASEFNIQYYKSKNKLEDLIEFVREYSDKTINVSFPEGIHMPTATSIAAVGDNVRFMLGAGDVMYAQKVRDAGLKFFFDSTIPASDYCTFSALLGMGVCALYVSNDLCYNIGDVHDICEGKGVQVRCVLNRIPSSAPGRQFDPKSFVYLPQDIDILAKYHDVFEFECGKPFDWARFDVLYRTFFEQKRWNGDISEINGDVRFPLNDKALMPHWSLSKMNCERRCDSRMSNHCSHCTQFLKTQALLVEKGYGIKAK